MACNPESINQEAKYAGEKWFVSQKRKKGRFLSHCVVAVAVAGLRESREMKPEVHRFSCQFVRAFLGGRWLGCLRSWHGGVYCPGLGEF